MTVETLPEIKFHEKAQSITHMWKDVRDKENSRAKNILVAAAEDGWFTNGNLISKLDHNEIKFFKKVLKSTPEAEGAKSMPIVSILNKYHQGAELQPEFSIAGQREYPFLPSVVVMRNKFGDRLLIRSWVYATMVKRHPTLKWHQTTFKKDSNSAVILVDPKWIWGLVMPIPMELFFGD